MLGEVKNTLCIPIFGGKSSRGIAFSSASVKRVFSSANDGELYPVVPINKWLTVCPYLNDQCKRSTSHLPPVAREKANNFGEILCQDFIPAIIYGIVSVSCLKTRVDLPCSNISTISSTTECRTAQLVVVRILGITLMSLDAATSAG